MSVFCDISGFIIKPNLLDRSNNIMAQQATLEIQRAANSFPTGAPAENIFFDVHLDGKPLAIFKTGEIKSLAVTPGKHVIKVRRYVMTWTSGNMGEKDQISEVQSTIAAGETRRIMFNDNFGKLNIVEIKNPVSFQPSNSALKSIFISYRRSDSADISGRIYDRLVGKFGRDQVFKDVDSIPLGSNFKSVLDSSVGACKVMLAIIGKGWLDAKDANSRLRLHDPADFVRLEVESALNRNIPVIPLLVAGASMPAKHDLPQSLGELAYRNGIAIRPDPDFHNDMNRLIASLEKMLM
jgi:hypothetical protein